MFSYMSPDGEITDIGEWSPARLDQSAPGFVNAHITGNRETAERWTAELAAGTLPEPTKDLP